MSIIIIVKIIAIGNWHDQYHLHLHQQQLHFPKMIIITVINTSSFATILRLTGRSYLKTLLSVIIFILKTIITIIFMNVDHL